MHFDQFNRCEFITRCSAAWPSRGRFAVAADRAFLLNGSPSGSSENPLIASRKGVCAKPTMLGTN